MAQPVSVDLSVSDDRMSAVLVVELPHGAIQPDLSTWTPGPLPVVQPANRTTQRLGHEQPTDEATRKTLVANDQADALYGRRDFDRQHLNVADGGQLVALEILVERPRAGSASSIGFLAIHVLAPESAVSEEQRLSWWSDLRRERRRSGEMWDRVAELIGAPIEPRARSHNLAFIAVGAPGAHALALGYAVIGGLEAEVSPDVLERAGLHEWTLTKPDWSALVLRDGATFVCHQASAEPFGPMLRMLMHTIHLDVLLLALLQRHLIDRSGDGAVKVDLDHPDALVDLEKAHYDFKRTYWRTSITAKRTAPPDVILRAFQEELLTTLDVNDVETRVRDGARLSLSLNASRQEASQEKLNRLVQDASIVIGSFTLCYTAAPVITTPSSSHFLIATTVALLLVVAIFGFLIVTGRRPVRGRLRLIGRSGAQAPAGGASGRAPKVVGGS